MKGAKGNDKLNMKAGKSNLKYAAQKPVVRQEEDESEKDSRAELTKLEVELCKQNFVFYDKSRQGYVERFELPLILKGKLIM